MKKLFVKKPFVKKELNLSVKKGYTGMKAKWVSCNSNGSPNISGIRQPGGLKFGVYQPLTECWSHTKFQPNRTSGYKDMANFLILLNKN